MKHKFASLSGNCVVLGILMALFFGGLNIARAEPEAVLIEFWDDFEENSGFVVKNTPWQEILDQYLNDKDPSGISLFDYEGVSDADHEKLKTYLSYLTGLDPRQFQKAEVKAYWINLYNASVVELVIDALKSEEVSSIRELRSGVFTPGPWKRTVHTITLQDMTLDDIQHGVIRPVWKDHRIHFALTKATLGGANLPKTAFSRENTEELLEQAEKVFLAHPRAVRSDDDDLVLSSLFDWYASDFAADKALFLEYLRENMYTDIVSPLNVTGRTRFDYDWDLNKASGG